MSRKIVQEFLKEDESNLSPFAKKFLVNAKEIAFDEVQDNEFVKEVQNEILSLYSSLLPLLNPDDKQLLQTLDEAQEALVFLSSYISYSLGWKDASMLYSKIATRGSN